MTNATHHTYTLIHAFSRIGQAACGMSNDEDNDAPASHNRAEVSCAACLALPEDDPYATFDTPTPRFNPYSRG
jgi:hypothetical protein